MTQDSSNEHLILSNEYRDSFSIIFRNIFGLTESGSRIFILKLFLWNVRFVIWLSFATFVFFWVKSYFLILILILTLLLLCGIFIQSLHCDIRMINIYFLCFWRIDHRWNSLVNLNIILIVNLIMFLGKADMPIAIWIKVINK